MQSAGLSGSVALQSHVEVVLSLSGLVPQELVPGASQSRAGLGDPADHLGPGRPLPSSNLSEAVRAWPRLHPTIININHYGEWGGRGRTA